MEFKRMSHVSVSEEIIEYIKTLITNRKLKPGDQLPSEEKMAGQMGVGRGTVREALKVLIYTGFIDRENKRTYVSRSVSEKLLYPKDITENIEKHRDVMEMIEVRKVIEPESAGLSADKSNPDAIMQIENYYQLMLNGQNNVEHFIDYDNKFHLAIIHATENKIFIEIMKSIQKLMKKNQALVLRKSKDIMPRSLEFHKKIFRAIRDGERAAAKRYMLNHILDIEKEMYAILAKEKKD